MATTTRKRYEWTVVQAQERQGFRKTQRVNAATIGQALIFAYDELAASGYNPELFTVVSATRGQEVGS